IERKPVDVVAFVREVVERMAPSLTRHNCHVEVRGEPFVVKLDPTRIEQVLANLIGNATKYGEPAKEIRIVVAYDVDSVTITVTNFGEGLTADELARVFSRFFRTQQARIAGADGLGLGLYISHGIIEAHGGKMIARSTPHETTTLGFVLPVR